VISNKLKAALFDLDDTLATWDAVAEETWMETCRKFATRVHGIQVDLLYTTIKEMREWYQSDPERHRYMRMNLEKYRREMMEMVFDRLGINNPDLAVQIADSYSNNREKATSLLPGAIELLNRLRKEKIKTGLITNGSSRIQRRKIERFNLACLFDSILIEEEFGAGKPDEKIFLHSLDKLDAKPNQTWMVGDDLERDIAGAKRVGIFAIWVDWRGKAYPDHPVSSQIESLVRFRSS
jgi:putative hydrolase of the HAD superfamily